MIKRYQDAGARRIVIFSQQMGAEMADGKALEWVQRVAPVVERA